MPVFALVLAVVVSACGSPTAVPRTTNASADDDGTSWLMLVESTPVETTLDHPEIPDAWEIWPKMIAMATRTIDFAEFYASDAPNSRLSPIVQEIEKAASRGVKIRFLVDASFAKKYPDTLERFERVKIEVRRFEVAKTMGGILHAKYFVVDGQEAFVGSQNFDWRALEHIQEMGVRVSSRPVARALLDVFETDWALAGGAPASTRLRSATTTSARVASTGERIRFVASPKDWLPNEDSWDLTAIESLVRRAKRSIDVQVLLYKPAFRDGSAFMRLDDALRAAAHSDVHVRLLVSDWSAKPDARGALEGLARAGVEVRVITIPPWSGGEIPFARVAHAKYMIVDGESSWVGTSNWEGDYFFHSRNVGFVIDGAPTAKTLGRVFADTWGSAYTKTVDAAVTSK